MAMLLSDVYCRKYYLENEVEEHCNHGDFWVVMHDNVIDLSNFLSTIHHLNIMWMFDYGGRDITHFFNEDGNPVMSELLDLTAFYHRSKSSYGKANHLYWWNDPVYKIGEITECAREVLIIEVETGKNELLTVCEEDSIYTIQDKYYAHRGQSDEMNTIWRRLKATYCESANLELDKTLTENGIPWEPTPEQFNSILWIFREDLLTITCSKF